MGLTECQYSPEDVYAAKAISRIRGTGGVRIMFTQMSGLTPYSMYERAGRNVVRKKTSHPCMFPHSSFSTYFMPYSQTGI